MDKFSGKYEQPTFNVTATTTHVDVSVTVKEPWETVKSYLMDFDRGANENPGSDFMVSNVLALVPNVRYMAGLNGSEDWVLLSISGSLGNGGVGTVTYTIRGVRKIATIGCDFSNFSKPIIGYVFPNESVEEATNRASRLTMWQNMKTRDYIDAYVKYQYRFADSTNPETPSNETSSLFLMKDTNDRVMADKIKRGIETIERFVPVITITYRSAKMPIQSVLGGSDLAMSNIGTQGGRPSVAGDFQICPGSDRNDAISEITNAFDKVLNVTPKQAKEPSKKRTPEMTWIITRDSLQTLHDLSYERRIQYMGFTDVDEELYPRRN